VQNFSPHRPCGQAYTYPFEVMASMRSWHEAFKAGECNEVQARYWKPKDPEELYVIADDPCQINNVIHQRKHEQTAHRLRNIMVHEMLSSRDTGLIPEGMYPALAGAKTIREFAQSEGFPASDVLSAAVTATSTDERRTIEELLELSRSESPIVRYWAATGGLCLGRKAGPMKERLLQLLEDSSLDVRVIAAEALGHIGEVEKAAPVLVEVLKTGNEHEALAAITALEAFGRAGILPMERVTALIPKKVKGDCNRIVKAIETIR
jgi:hypothetical protein